MCGRNSSIVSRPSRTTTRPLTMTAYLAETKKPRERGFLFSYKRANYFPSPGTFPSTPLT